MRGASHVIKKARMRTPPAKLTFHCLRRNIQFCTDAAKCCLAAARCGAEWVGCGPHNLHSCCSPTLAGHSSLRLHCSDVYE